jgi:hypothetical protein
VSDRSSNRLQLVRAGDDGAYRQLIERFRAPVVAVGLASLLPPEEAILVAEQTLGSARGLAATAPSEDAFGRILIEHAQNVAQAFAPAPGGPLVKPALGALVTSGQVSRRPGAGIAVKGDLTSVVRALIAAVPPEARLSVALRTYAGLDYAGIASLQGLAPARVAHQLATAMETLADLVAGEALPGESPAPG